MNDYDYRETTGPPGIVVEDSRLFLECTAQCNHSWFVRSVEGQNRSYFTYYSEFNRSSRAIVYIEIFFLMLLMVISTIGNSLIIYVVLSNKKLRSNTYLFIANMCVADILFTMTNPVIAIVRYQESWQLGDSSCGFLVYIEAVCAFVSIWSMTLISMDRHRCIVRTQYKSLNPLTSKMAIAVCWILALGLSVPVIVYFNVEEFAFGTGTVKVCTLMWPRGPRGAFVRVSAVFVTLSCILGFFIPLGLILYNYISIFKTLWNTRTNMIRQLSKQLPEKSRQSNGRVKTQVVSDARNRRDFRAVKMLVSTVVIFGLMWLPMCIVLILILKDGITEQMKTGSWALLLAACIACANACVNPVLYGLLNEKFKSGVKKALRCLTVSGLRRKSTNSKSAIQSVSALAELERTATPPSSSVQWNESCSSLSDVAAKTAETAV